MAHTSAHCLDLAVALDTIAREIVDFCYDCDDFVTRTDGVIVGVSADECQHNQSADDDSHEVRHAPTVTRPYQARTVHYLGRMVYVSNAGTSVIRTYTLQGSYGTSPGRVVCQSYRSR